MGRMDKPLVWLRGEVKTPPFSQAARLEAGYVLSRLLTKSASSVLASFKSSTYPRGYASGLHSLRPCWTAFLNSLRLIVRSFVTCSVLSTEALR